MRTGLLDLDNLDPEDNQLFNETAIATRHEFDRLVAAVSEPHAADIDWIVSSVPSRNKYHSPLFIRCCRLAFVNRILAIRREPVEIRVADRALADVLRRGLARSRPDVVVRCTETPYESVWRVLRPIRQWILAGGTLALRWASRKPAGRLRSGPPLVLVDTFVLNNQSGDEGSIMDGRYKDRYYPGLREALEDSEARSIVYLPTIVGFRNPATAFRLIRSCRDTAFMVHDDYLRLVDYLYVLASPFRLLRLAIRDSEFEGYDVTRMLRQERLRNCSDFIGLLGVLYYRFTRRLAEDGVSVRLLIEWYENQVFDRGMILGFHRYHPATRIVGYQGYVIAQDLHIYTHPTATEVRGGAAPDVVKVTGSRLQDDIQEFTKEIEVGVAPGFRFQKLWRARRSYPERSAYTVLVGLPIGLDDAAHILDLLSSDERLTDGTLRIRVKPHPTWSPERIRALLPAGRFPERWTFLTGDFHEGLETVNILIGNASSVCLEALAKGVPVIVVAPRTGILQNVIPRSVDPAMWTVCREVSEICAAIDRFRTMQPADMASLEQRGLEIRSGYFEPVTRTGVLDFLELKSRD